MGAVRVSSARRQHAEQRLESLSSGLSPSLDLLGHVPSKIIDMFDVVYSLPMLEPITVSSVVYAPRPEAGRRSWETSKTGYVNWTVAKLIEKAKDAEKEYSIEKLQDFADAVSKVDKLKSALNEFHAEAQ